MMSDVNLLGLVRNKIKALKAYHVDPVDCGTLLHANENPYPPAAELQALFLQALPKLPLNRYPDPDCVELKEAIAKQICVPSQNLVLGNGSDELIQLLLQIFCDEGDAIIFPDPTFSMYSIIAKGLGLAPTAFPLDDQWDFKADQLLKIAQEVNARIIFLSYPNNPTGNCFSEEQVRKVIEECPGIVVLDEAYYDFSRKSFLNEMKEHNNLIVTRSLSKIGLAGLRVGFAVASPIIVGQINKVRLPYNSNAISQTFAKLLLNRFDLVQIQIKAILAERDRLLDGLSKLEGIMPFPTDANFILFRVDGKGDDFFRYLIDSDILVRNLGTHPRLTNCLRVTVGTAEENDRFLSLASQAIRKVN